MTYENIQFERNGAVAVITINRPKVLNALSAATRQELGAALREVEADVALRVAIITGAGEKAFVAGADIGELQALESPTAARQVSERGHEVGFEIARMSKVVIAAINGFALGGGLELAMSCDIRVAAETAQFGQPEINLGIIPGWGGTQRLTRLVGSGMAKLLNLTGERIDAHEALRVGLIDRVVPAAELMDAARTLANTIAAKAPTAVGAIKQAVNRGMEMPLVDACMYEAALFGEVVASEDGREGINAFLEKRAPVWRVNSEK